MIHLIIPVAAFALGAYYGRVTAKKQPVVVDGVFMSDKPEELSQEQITQVLQDSADIVTRMQPMVVNMVSKAVKVKQTQRKLGDEAAKKEWSQLTQQAAYGEPLPLLIDAHADKVN
jgi:hypothetical protein